MEYDDDDKQIDGHINFTISNDKIMNNVSIYK